MIHRHYSDLDTYIRPNKVLVLYGPRRVGKTYLLNQFLKQTTYKYRLDNGDDLSVQEIFNSQSIDKISRYAQDYELIVLDEAQRIPNIGMGLKILVDHVPGIKVIATGSASFDLSNKVGEPLTGRMTRLHLYPVAQLELLEQYNQFDLSQRKEQYLIYGSYPEVLLTTETEKKREYLREIVNSYLLKDILELENVKAAKILLDLLRLIAFQVGQEVSLNELAGQLGIDVKTVGRYLDLFEKAFVLVNLRGFSRNLRTEVTKKSKYYFYDNGIRNGIISNFNALPLRDDIGALWENFILCERLKKQAYTHIFANNYFWRTWNQQEIDWVEERDGKVYGFEFKWSAKKLPPAPKDWAVTYPESEFAVITPDNYLDFVV